MLLISLFVASAPFTVVATEGEASRDFSTTETTYLVVGDRVHYDTRLSGRARENHMGGDDMLTGDGTFSDVSALDNLLIALDKVPQKKGKLEPLIDTSYQRVCITRENKERCAQALHGAAPSPELKAMNDIVQALNMVAMRLPGMDANDVLAVEREWCTAYLKNDAAALERILLDDYTLTNSKGIISTKADDVKEAKDKEPKYSVFENKDMKARVHGDTAVVTGVTTVVGVAGGKPFKTRFQFTDTLIRLKGTWRPLAGHVTKLPD